MMNIRVEELANRAEDAYFDRKSCRLQPKSLLRPVIAFANAGGGEIAIGIEDDGMVCGFSPERVGTAMEEYRAYVFQHCRPIPEVKYETLMANLENERSERIILVKVKASASQVVWSLPDEKVYLRMADRSMELSYAQIQALEYDKGQRSYEDTIVEDAKLSDLDMPLIEEYCRALHAEAKHTPEEVLTYRGLLVNGRLTVGALVLFGKHPAQFLPQARVRFIRYEGKQKETGRRINIIKDENFELPLPRLIPAAAQLVRAQLRDFQMLDTDGKFRIVPEYPEFAWFEGLVNAVTHRDYGITGDYIRISMFDDRLEIFSPGKLPNVVTLENMKYTRFSRNPKIARILCEFGWVKELNEGVNRIYDEMGQLFLKGPSYSEPNDNAVQLMLENNVVARHMRNASQLERLYTEEVWRSLSQDERCILMHVYACSKITTKEAAVLSGRGVLTARKMLKRLEQMGVLVWYGSSVRDPAQYYAMKQ